MPQRKPRDEEMRGLEEQKAVEIKAKTQGSVPSHDRARTDAQCVVLRAEGRAHTAARSLGRLPGESWRVQARGYRLRGKAFRELSLILQGEWARG